MFELRSPRTEAEFTAYYDLRWRVLREPWGQPRGSERDDLEPTADHLAAWDEHGVLWGVGRLHLNSPAEAQIRFMAVEPGCWGRGIGRELVRRLETMARQRGVPHIVLQAREEVQEFYAREGYLVVESGPTLFGTVRHVKMMKVLIV